MAVICFASSGVPGVGGLAARVLGKGLSGIGAHIVLYDCRDGGSSTHAVTGPCEPEQHAEDSLVTNRQFISDVRRLGSSHDHLLVDLSTASEVISAIAFSMADLVLVPLHTSGFNQPALRKTFGILETVSANRRRPLDHAVFLVSEAGLPSSQMLLNISGLLMLRGLRALPVALCEKSAAIYLGTQPDMDRNEPQRPMDDDNSTTKLFVGSVMTQLPGQVSPSRFSSSWPAS